MKKTLLYFLLCLSFTGFAQDWAPFKTTDSIRHFVGENSINSFSNNYKPIQSVSFDSSFSDSSGLNFVFEKGFSVYNLYDQSRSNFGQPQDIIKGRILGDVITYYQDSTIVNTLDSFGFRLNFPGHYFLNQNFTFGTSINYSLNATCDSIYTDLVNGQIDSIVKLSLAVYNQNSILDSSHHFNCNFLIAKTNGLILTPDFTDLDSLHYYNAYFILKEQLNDRPFNLDVGDEYHYERDTSDYFDSNSNYILSSYFGFKATVTADSNSGVNRVYTITEEYGSGFPGSYGFLGTRTYNTSYDTTITNRHTLKSAIIEDSLLVPFNSNSFVPITIYGVEDTKSAFKLFKTRVFPDFFFYSNPNSWPPVVDSLNTYSSFYASIYRNYIGLTDEYYRNGYGGNGSSSTSKSLAYFKKGNQTWGTPLNLAVGLEEANQNGTLRLYPNPASNQLRIETEERLRSILVSDINGKAIEVNINNNLVDVSNLSSGLYFIQVQTEKGILREKFIKE